MQSCTKCVRVHEKNDVPDRSSGGATGIVTQNTFIFPYMYMMETNIPGRHAIHHNITCLAMIPVAVIDAVVRSTLATTFIIATMCRID